MSHTTQPANPVDHNATLGLARQLAYRFLSLAMSDPRSKRWHDLHDDVFLTAVLSAAEYLSTEPQCRVGVLAPGELAQDSLDFAPLLRIIRDPQIDLNTQYERIFGLMLPKKCPPYETEYCPQTFSVYRSQTLADIAGFYRAFGLEPSRDMPERDDHIALELEFMAYLLAKERRAADTEQATICRDAQKRFAREHLAWWVPAFARALEQQSARMDGPQRESIFYALVASALAAFIPIERAILEIDPPKELVAPGPVEPQEEMSCSACAGSCERSQPRSYNETQNSRE
ncbi:hypothetical protein BH09PLA1_BH09PLA1_00100 [soil metagenome]